MPVKKMIKGKSGMFHDPNPATVGEIVAVIPWDEWEAAVKAAREEGHQERLEQLKMARKEGREEVLEMACKYLAWDAEFRADYHKRFGHEQG